MSEKHPAWTRVRVGRNRVRWVAYDDRAGAEDRQVIAEGYAASLPEADAAARSALAAAGMYQARRMSTNFKPSDRGDRDKVRRPPPSARSTPVRPREYLYTRRQTDDDGDDFLIAAHLILKKTAKRVYVTRRSYGPDQLGTEDERWDENEPKIAVDRIRLECDGSVYSSGHRHSNLYATREAAMGETSPRRVEAAFRVLGIQPPSSVEEIKAAYRRKAFDVHPDRGGSPADFLAVEAAYRRLLREAQAPESSSLEL